MIAIGIDIGGTGIKAGALDELGNRRAEARELTPSDQGPDALLTVLAEMVRRLRETVGEGIWSLGIGCAGLIAPDAGIVRTSPNLALWRNVPLADLVVERIGRRPVVLNDANAFTLAEARLGAARGANSVIGLTLGTGVGGGLILGGRLWDGVHGYAGEIGHAPLLVDGPICACGARGCLEALIGTQAILKRYQERAGLSNEERNGLTPLLLSERARQGDLPAQFAFRETGRLLGLALGGLVHILDPEVIVVGGGILGSADLLLPAAREAMAGSVMLRRSLVPPILPAALGNAAGWIGAALAALDRP